MKDNIGEGEVFLNIGETKYTLKVPTVWSPTHKKWSGYIETPVTNRRIYGEGCSMLQWQDSIRECLTELMSDNELAEEIKQMFMEKNG